MVVQSTKAWKKPRETNENQRNQLYSSASANVPTNSTECLRNGRTAHDRRVLEHSTYALLHLVDARFLFL